MKSETLTIAIFLFRYRRKREEDQMGRHRKIKRCLFENLGKSYPSCTYLPSLSTPSLPRRTIYIDIKPYSLLEVSLAYIVRLRIRIVMDIWIDQVYCALRKFYPTGLFNGFYKDFE